MSKMDIFQVVADEIGVDYQEVSGIQQSFSSSDYPYFKVETISYGDFLIEGVRCLKMMEKLKQEKTKSECCKGDPEAIKWNSFNEAVQCHSCGRLYVPKKYGKQLKEVSDK